MLIGIQLIKLFWQMNKLLMVKDGDQEHLLKEKNLISGFLILLNFQMNYWKVLDTLNEWPDKVKLMQKIGLENHLVAK